MLGFNGRFDDLPLETKPRELDWSIPKSHFDGVKKFYLEKPEVLGIFTALALEAVLRPLAERYENGERSEELYDAMMAVE